MAEYPRRTRPKFIRLKAKFSHLSLPSSSLVMPVSARLQPRKAWVRKERRMANSRARSWSFADKCAPKLELGHERKAPPNLFHAKMQRRKDWREAFLFSREGTKARRRKKIAFLRELRAFVPSCEIFCPSWSGILFPRFQSLIGLPCRLAASSTRSAQCRAPQGIERLPKRISEKRMRAPQTVGKE